MIDFKFRFEHFVIIILLAILILDNCSGSDDQNCADQTTVVKVSERIIKKKDSVFNDNIKNRNTSKVQVIETPEKVQIILDPEKLSHEERGQLKEAYRYIDTTRISDGFVISDILAEGRILKLDLKTSINHLKQTIETTKTITRKPGGFYISPGVSYSPLFGIEDINAGVTFIKGSLGASFSMYYNFTPASLQQNLVNNHFGLRLQLHIKI